MSDPSYQLFIGLILGVALIAQLGSAVYFAYGRKWRSLAQLGRRFLTWLFITLFVFLAGVGFCAAGCPDEPFELILAALICTPSVLTLVRLVKR